METIISIFWALLLAIFELPSVQSAPLAGSRGLIVRNDAEQSSILELLLRQCDCGKVANDSLAICPCWGNFSLKDQPAAQGDPRIISKYFLEPLSSRYGFFKEGDTTLCCIPSPTRMKDFLKTIALDDYFEFIAINGLVDENDYLALIAQGKLPIAGIADESPAGDLALKYQYYFHDLFNHAFIWIFMPQSVRELIINRAGRIVDLGHSIDSQLTRDNLLFWQLIKLRTSALFDSAMASLNNRLFDQNSLKPGLAEKVIDDFNGMRSEENISVIRLLLEASMNFGLFPSDTEKENSIPMISDHNMFTYYLMSNMIDSSESFLFGKDKYINREKTLDKNRDFEILFELSHDKLREISATLKNKISFLLEVDPNHIDEAEPFISWEEFMSEIANKMHLLKVSNHQRAGLDFP